MKNEIKSCIICKKEIPKNNGEICHSCSTFFRWKYGKKYKDIMKLYKRLFRSTKSSGGKNMDSYKCSCGAYTTNEDGICDMCEIREIENEASLREENEE